MAVEHALAQAWAKVQAAPHGGQPAGQLVDISAMGDRVGATCSNANVFKNKKSTFPLVGGLTLTQNV